MAGLYIHIPFCKQACHYCNFHFSTSLKQKNRLVKALLRELALQKDYLKGAPLQSVYFGGGTPSLLPAADIQALLHGLRRYHDMHPEAEITLEANPDDLSPAYLESLSWTGINRLSIGLQSFVQEDLEFMNRAHSAQEAEQCLEWARAAGFKDLTVDLIYGSPFLSNAQWLENIEKVIEARVPHISCYALTVEPKTALAHFVKTGKYPAPSEERAAQHFELLLERLTAAGYEQYEISNFCIPPHYAQHNSNYWLAKPYLGVGPSAHSFNGENRQWNVANNPQYYKAIEAGEVPCELEQLSSAERFNEYLLTGLRTKWGCSAERLREWGEAVWTHFQKEAATFLDSGHLEEQVGRYVLSPKGRLLADYILSRLFLDT